VFVFKMPVIGSLWLVALIEVVGALAFAGIGLLIAARAQTTETVSGLMNLVMLPMWIFSGVFFSAQRFPENIQPFIQALPLTAVVDALRANILRGAGWQALAPEMTIIAAWLAVSFLLAVRLFRWR
jgi:ABC-2 type transport system permease protein